MTHIKYLVICLALLTSSTLLAAPFTVTLPHNQWRMISLPATPPASANTVEAILDDDMAAGGVYGQNWVVYAYDTSANGYGSTLSLADTMETGKGYWVIQNFKKGGVTLDMPVNSSETPAAESIPLAASKDGSNQWNLAGNPLATSLTLGDLRLTTNAPSCSDGNCNLDKAKGNNLVHNKVWIYNGNSYEEKGTGDRVDAWIGFWMAALGGSKDYTLSLGTEGIASDITSLSDYDFIGEGYGQLTTPSTPAPGVQKPYVPDLTHIRKEDVLYVAEKGQGNGASESSPANIESLLSRGSEIKGKTIIALDGSHPVQLSEMKNIEDVRLIAKNKGKAKLVSKGSSTIFSFKDADTNIHDFSIIGFEALNSEGSHNNNYFIFNSGTAVSSNVYKIYLSDMKWHDFHTVLYSGLHSHDWTIDKSIHYDSTYSYTWYMMGWHHSVINSVMYENTDHSLAIRGSYVPDEEYSYAKGCETTIQSRMDNGEKHHLKKDDWTHLIANNTFGSNHNLYRYKHSSPARKSWTHITLYYKIEGGPNKSEACYYPPQNVAIVNNVFVDNSTNISGEPNDGFNRHPLQINVTTSKEYGGINTGRLDSVNGIVFAGNFTDTNINPWDEATQKSNTPNVFISSDHSGMTNADVADDNTVVTNTADFSFTTSNGFKGIGADYKYDYSISSTSVLKDKSIIGSLTYKADSWQSGLIFDWTPKADVNGNARLGVPDVGAYESQ